MSTVRLSLVPASTNVNLLDRTSHWGLLSEGRDAPLRALSLWTFYTGANCLRGCWLFSILTEKRRMRRLHKPGHLGHLCADCVPWGMGSIWWELLSGQKTVSMLYTILFQPLSWTQVLYPASLLLANLHHYSLGSCAFRSAPKDWFDGKSGEGMGKGWNMMMEHFVFFSSIVFFFFCFSICGNLCWDELVTELNGLNVL